MWSVVWNLAVAGAACLSQSDSATLDSRLSDAEAAYADLEPEEFARSMDDATLLLPCVADLLPPSTVAKYHRMEALRLYGADEDWLVEASLRAARTLEPTYVFPDALLPPEHELRRTYEGLLEPAGATHRPPQPRDGRLAFDGTLTARAPVDRSTVVQLLDDDGVRGTRVVRPGEPLPPFDARPRARTQLLVGSGVALVTSATLYGFARSQHAPFWDTSLTPTREQLARYQSTANTLSALSATSLGLSAVGVTLAFAWADSGRAPPGARW